MYDKNRIEDSLEFVRQMKEFMDSDDALDEFDPFEDNDSDELFVNLAYHMEPEVPPKENAVQDSHAMGDSFGVPDAGVIQEQRRLAEERLRLEQEEARRKQAELEQQKRLAEERRRLEEEAAKRRQAEQEQQRRLEEERRRLEEEAAKRKQAELEQQRRLEEERRRLEEEAKRRRQAELQEKQRQEAERKKIEEERKRLAEEQKRQEEARRLWEEERCKAQEETKRREAELAEKKCLEEEKQRLAQEEARRKQAELAEKKRLEEERRRLAQEEARRKEAELAEKKRLEEERKRLAQEAERRRQAELQEKQRQEAERKKIEEERKRLAEEQRRQEQARRQLEKERQRLVEEQLQRELEEQRRILAEQARKKAEEKAKKEAEEKERRRKLLQEEEQRKKELQAREEEQRRKAQEEEKKQEEQRLAAASQSKQNTEIPDQTVAKAADPESEVEQLRKRAEELKRQAEMATLEARMRQLQLEAEGISTGESVLPPQTDTTANGGNRSAGNSTLSDAVSNAVTVSGSNSIPMPMLSIPGVQPGTMVPNTGQQTVSNSQDTKDKQKLSKEEIDSIFANELKRNSSDSSYQQRKMMLQKQADRLKRKREETGEKLPLELAKEKAAQAKDITMGTARKLREFVLDKMTDPENAESREKTKKIMTNVLVVMICIVAAFLVSSIVTNFVAHPTKVEGESMETTLTDGDTVIIQKLSYYFGTPDRYDVVVFPIYNSKTYFIKRVIGLPGETVLIEEGKVYINGKELEDDIYGKDEYIDDPGDAGEPITLASDEYFVLGDNRNMSTDSRSSYVGVIKKKNIAGKAWRRVLPFSKFGKVK